MLTSLYIKDLIVVHVAELNFERGLTVLTGESGAGKSVMIEALNLAIGGRADTQSVRIGAEKAVVTAHFDLSNCPEALKFLEQHALAEGSECIVRRVVNSDGKSQAYCNSARVTLTTLRSLSKYLIDINTQRSEQTLLKKSRQLELLDDYGDLSGEKTNVSRCWAEWRKIAQQIRQLESSINDPAKQDLLRYQVEELTNADLNEKEVQQLETAHKKLSNISATRSLAEKIQRSLVEENSGILAQLREAFANARAMGQFEPAAENLQYGLEQALTAAEEAEVDLSRMSSNFEDDPGSLNRIEQRLTFLHDLARKHKVSISELPELRSTLANALEGDDNRRSEITSLKKCLRETLKDYEKNAAKLHQKREKIAKKMGRDIETRIRDLGIPRGVFTARVAKLAEDQPQESGMDQVEFYVSTNPERSPAPLAKVVSGGELSRITLAIRAATSEVVGLPIVVYDEIDTGVGGPTANIIGHNLRNIAEFCQVLCITHSAQVASAGEHHFLAIKKLQNGSSFTELKNLEDKERISEVARMISSTGSANTSLAHARNLLKTSRR